jgi:hypothetical protein
MSKLRLKPRKPKMRKPARIDDDPNLDDDAKMVLKASLRLWARATMPKRLDMSDAEVFDGVVELYEHGYLRGVQIGDRIGFEPCLPKDAPQLRIA